MKEVRCIHLTNLHSLCEQVGRSSTPSTKQKLNQLKLFFPKRKSYIPTIPKEWNQKNVFFFNLPKIGNLYYVNTDQLQYVNKDAVVRFYPTTELNLRTALGVEICKLCIIARIWKPLSGKFSDLCREMGICSDVM